MRKLLLITLLATLCSALAIASPDIQSDTQQNTQLNAQTDAQQNAQPDIQTESHTETNSEQIPAYAVKSDSAATAATTARKDPRSLIRMGCLDLGYGGMDLVYNGFIYGLGVNSIYGLTKGDVFKAGFGYRGDVYTNFLCEYKDPRNETMPGHSLGIDFIAGAGAIINITNSLSIGILIGPEVNLELISARILNFGFGTDICLAIATGGPTIGVGATIKVPAVIACNFDAIRSPMFAILPYIGLEL